MSHHFFWSILLVPSLLIAQTQPAGVSVADFESGVAPAVAGAQASASLQTDAPAQGKAFLRIERAGDLTAPAGVRLPLPAGANAENHAGVRAAFRAEAEGPVALRWLALDESGKLLFQRRFTLHPREQWVTIDEPLAAWRWASDRTGDWDEVRTLALRIESSATSVDLDDVRLAGDGATPGAAHPDAETLLKLAFEDAPSRHLLRDGIFIATDAVDELSDADLEKLAHRGAAVRAFIRRAFAPVLRPTSEPAPVSLLIFRRREGEQAFHRRLGAYWRADVAPSTSGGYTLQDISTSTYDPRHGADRPVWLHELTHGIVARHLRVISGWPKHRWLQEGLANYVQLVVYPGSLDPRAYAGAFGQPVGANPRGLFRPLDELLEKDVDARGYAQAASLIAYLLERDPETLQALARGVADGQPPRQVLQQRGSSVQKLQDDWHAWGRQRYVEPPEPPKEHFSSPPELKDLTQEGNRSNDSMNR